nr:precorrin-2 C(20)-methyltransferase [Sedimentibacter sp.]
MEQGMFYGIGVGVGSMDAVTKKASDTLNILDVLYVPAAKKDDSSSTAHEIIKSFINSTAVVKDKHFPMSYNTEELKNSWQTIADEIEQDVKEGKKVGFVTIGDPMVYSTYIYLLKILKHKINITTIPGITSFLDIASRNNFPLVEGEDPLLVIPATMDTDKLKSYIRSESSIVLMKVYRNFDAIIDLILSEKLEHCSLAVSNSSKEDERVYKNIRDLKKEDVSYFTTILINKKWEI